jgi:hypothetical protein
VFAQKNTSIDLLQKHNLSYNSKLLLFAGSFDYMPNQLALKHLVHDVYPILAKEFLESYKIILCGIGLVDFIKQEGLQLPSNFIVEGFVDDVDVYFNSVSVFINPVSIGEGIQTKNIDALANNCNVVCYKNRNMGMPFYLENLKIFFANQSNPNDFVTQIKCACKQSTIPTSMQFFADYNWNKLVIKV